MSSRTLLESFLILVSVLTACSPAPRSTPVSSPVPIDTLPRIVRTSWHPTHRATLLHYMLQDSSVLSISSDSATKEIPFITTARLQLAISAQGDSFVFNGLIDSVLMLSELQKSASSDTSLHISGSLSQHGGIRQIQPGISTPCKIGITPMTTRIADLLVEIPASISIGSQWIDSSTTVVCHGKIALKQIAIRTYHLTSDTTWQTHAALRIDRSTLLLISEIETDSTNHSSATGKGSMTAVLLLDPNTGELLESSSHGTVFLTISTDRGTFPFNQLSSIRIRQQ